jgi:outer membrane protein OmpA-like peptidoglycan-associated protein
MLAMLTLSLGSLLAGCAPSTRVTLLPQVNGGNSAVDVTTGQSTLQINQPYQVAVIGRSGTVALENTTADQVRKGYPSLLELTPPPAEIFVLEFETGSSTLTAASLAQLGTVVARAQARSGGEIVVTGHTDRQGSLEANDRLSLERAKAVRALLIEKGFQGNRIEAVGRGEREPLVPTEDEVAEPRNRRAEVLVR